MKTDVKIQQVSINWTQQCTKRIISHDQVGFILGMQTGSTFKNKLWNPLQLAKKQKLICPFEEKHLEISNTNSKTGNRGEVPGFEHIRNSYC